MSVRYNRLYRVNWVVPIVTQIVERKYELFSSIGVASAPAVDPARAIVICASKSFLLGKAALLARLGVAFASEREFAADPRRSASSSSGRSRAQIDARADRQRSHVGLEPPIALKAEVGEREQLADARDRHVRRAIRRRQTRVRGVFRAVSEIRVDVRIDPVGDDARPLRLRARASRASAREAIDAPACRLCSLPPSNTTRLLRLKRPCMSSSTPSNSPPSIGIGGIGVAHSSVKSSVFGLWRASRRRASAAQASPPSATSNALVERERRRRATLIEIALEADADGENRRERNDEHRGDERDAALIARRSKRVARRRVIPPPPPAA